MRKAFLILLFSLLLITACSSGQPTISIQDTQIKLGNVVNGEVVTRELQVNNLGAGDLIVDEIITSCSCTTATLSPMKIPAGGSGLLKIEFDSGFHGPDLTGQLIRQIFIKTNDPQQPETRIELDVFVEEVS